MRTKLKKQGDQCLEQIKQILESCNLQSISEGEEGAKFTTLCAAWTRKEQEGYSFLELPLENARELIEKAREYLKIFLSEKKLDFRWSETPIIWRDSLVLKDETVLPSGSFKDRQTLVLLTIARALNVQGVEIVSCGNAAISAAYLGRVFEMPVRVIVPVNVSLDKLKLLQNLGVQVEQRGANYEEAYRLTLENLGADGFWNITPGINPLAELGLFLIGYELAQNPDITDVLVPAGNGALLYGIFRGYQLYSSTYPESNIQIPRIHAVQIENLSPLAIALEQNNPLAKADGDPDKTKADAIAAIESYCLPKALKAIKTSGGSVILVGDHQIEEIIKVYHDLNLEFSAYSAIAAAQLLQTQAPTTHNICTILCAKSPEKRDLLIM